MSNHHDPVSGCDTGQRDKPNVVIIFMDDMGYGDLESYGGTGYKTPHTNRMAAEGMRLTHFYVSQPVCSASRASLLTGCYSNRIGISNALMPWSPIALNPNEETIAEVLKKEDYRTAMVGKWHLGDMMPYLPLQNGFDEYFGLPYSNDMWPVGYDGEPAGPEYETINQNKLRYPVLQLIDGNQKFDTVATLEDQAKLTTRYTKRACDFIRRQRKNPFFLYVAHSMPHVPLAASDRFNGKSKSGLYGDVMEELDWSVGEILRTLDETGLSEKTLVILTSDNGPWLRYGHHGGSSGGLREGKVTTWEGGVRVPCIMRWKGHIQPGTVSSQLASTIDLLPTISALCGAALPSAKIDGIDISTVLRNGANESPRDHFAYYWGDKLHAVRKGHWKLVFPHTYYTIQNTLPGSNGWPGEQKTLPTGLSLYNLQTDPGFAR